VAHVEHDWATNIFGLSGWHFWSISVYYNGYYEFLTNLDFHVVHNEYSDEPIIGRMREFKKRDHWGVIQNLDDLTNPGTNMIGFKGKIPHTATSEKYHSMHGFIL
jgi:hypothetical protein